MHTTLPDVLARRIQGLTGDLVVGLEMAIARDDLDRSRVIQESARRAVARLAALN